MIRTLNDLKEYLKYEKKLYINPGRKERLIDIATQMPNLRIWKFVRLLRKTEFFYNNRKNPFCGIMYLLYRLRKNNLGIKLGISIFENSFEKGLCIYHEGNIVVNGNARIGKNCKLHGSNCIGNSGTRMDNPVIGDNVRLGVGAKVIGGVQLADNLTVAAGAVVVHSFEEEGIVVGGIPAKKIK